eukprot:scaffold287521_cov18-Tisochrysis_lutea.AAC.1
MGEASVPGGAAQRDAAPGHHHAHVSRTPLSHRGICETRKRKGSRVLRWVRLCASQALCLRALDIHADDAPGSSIRRCSRVALRTC